MYLSTLTIIYDSRIINLFELKKSSLMSVISDAISLTVSGSDTGLTDTD
jgi:hypothetical protein